MTEFDFIPYLKKEISAFRQWAEQYQAENINFSGEWECDYCFWENIYTAFENVLNSCVPSQADEKLMIDMLYIIARDNEAENLIYHLCQYPEWFGFLCEKSLQTGESNAKWQFAAYLPSYPYSDKTKERTVDFVENFLNDKDEYVSRRAFQSMAVIVPEKVDEYAEFFWNDDKCQNDESLTYRRFTVLEALQIAKSDKTDYYMNLALSGNDDLLKNSAEHYQYIKKHQKENQIFLEKFYGGDRI